MKVLVTGVKGQLGSLVVAHAPSDWDVTGVDQEELDLTRTNQIAAFVRSCEPDVVINCAAYTNVDAAEGDVLWREASTGYALAGAVLWRVHLPPARTPGFVASLGTLDARFASDWGGGLVWVALDGTGRELREAAAAAGGEAILVLAEEAMRARIPTLHPRSRGVALLEERVRRAFDPAGLFETVRFIEGHHANQLST